MSKITQTQDQLNSRLWDQLTFCNDSGYDSLYPTAEMEEDWENDIFPEAVKIRIADHRQKSGGGYIVDSSGSGRAGNSNIDIVVGKGKAVAYLLPENGKWDFSKEADAVGVDEIASLILKEAIKKV